jgi:hypothetical protein
MIVLSSSAAAVSVALRLVIRTTLRLELQNSTCYHCQCVKMYASRMRMYNRAYLMSVVICCFYTPVVSVSKTAVKESSLCESSGNTDLCTFLAIDSLQYASRLYLDYISLYTASLFNTHTKGYHHTTTIYKLQVFELWCNSFHLCSD